MPFDWSMPLRRSTRLAAYDYAATGAYFVTICTQNRQSLLGEVVDDRFVPSVFGEIVSETWQWLTVQYPEVELDEWVVMPNHIHGIIVIDRDRNDGEGDSRIAPTERGTTGRRLGRYVGAFKTVSAKKINEARGTPGVQFWQHGYYDHIIRNDADLDRIRRYISENLVRWALDPDRRDDASS